MQKNRTLAQLVLYGVSGVVDIVQILITFTGIGIVVSEALEVAMPFVLFGLFSIFGISLINKPLRIASILAVGFGDALTGGIAPFWILDVWYIFSDVKREDGAASEAASREGALSNTIRQPLYQNGSRQPQRSVENVAPQKRNTDGIRPPGGGLGRVTS